MTNITAEQANGQRTSHSNGQTGHNDPQTGTSLTPPHTSPERKYKGLCDDYDPPATARQVRELISKTEFVLPGWFAKGVTNGIIAPAGGAKSAFLLWLARSICGGHDWFTGHPAPTPGKILFLSTEFDLSEFYTRADNWNIPIDDWFLFPFPQPDDAFIPVDLMNQDHIRRIAQVLDREQLSAVFVDSLRGAHSQKESDSLMSEVMKKLASMACVSNVPFFVTHHTTKRLAPGEEITPNDARGSSAIVALCRTLVGIDVPDADQPARFRVRTMNKNLKVDPRAYGFTVTDTGLEFGEPPVRPVKAESVPEYRVVMAWLRSALTYEWQDVRDVLATAPEQYPETLIRRAREALGVLRPHGVKLAGGKTYWRLPAPTGIYT